MLQYFVVIKVVPPLCTLVCFENCTSICQLHVFPARHCNLKKYELPLLLLQKQGYGNTHTVTHTHTHTHIHAHTHLHAHVHTHAARTHTRGTHTHAARTHTHTHTHTHSHVEREPRYAAGHVLLSGVPEAEGGVCCTRQWFWTKARHLAL